MSPAAVLFLTIAGPPWAVFLGASVVAGVSLWWDKRGAR